MTRDKSFPCPYPFPKLLVLIRHGRDEEADKSQKERRRFSSRYSSLTQEGREQARALGRWLRARYSFDRYFSSYYTRAREMIEIMYPTVTPELDARLTEIRRGVGEVIPRKKFDRFVPWDEITRKERDGAYHYRLDNGDSWADKEKDVRSFKLTLQMECDRKTVLVSTHGKPRTIFRGLHEGWWAERIIDEHRKNRPEFASATIYRKKGDRLILEIDNFAPWKNK